MIDYIANYCSAGGGVSRSGRFCAMMFEVDGMSELLRLERVNFSYDNKILALGDITVTVSKGERIAVMGGNGAGKSTFFLCCNGVLRPQSGKIFLEGKEITGAKKDVAMLRQTVGLVFQEPDSQIIAGSVESEVSFGPMNLNLDRGEVMRRVTGALAQTGLNGYESRAPQYLSGGEKKRVSVADILAMRPRLLLLDEPTACLDPKSAVLLEQTLGRLSLEGVTVAVSTHDVDFAWRFANRAILFHEGKIIADADIGEVFASGDSLARAGLERPLLYAASELIEKIAPEKIPGIRPKNLKEFAQLAERLR